MFQIVKFAVVLQVCLASSVLGYWYEQQPNNNFAGERRAIANFNNLDGVNGFIKFSQRDAFEPVIAQYDLQGLQGNIKLFHVHERPVPPFDSDEVKRNASMLTQLCSGPTVGGHYNPFGIIVKLPPTRALNQYEVGDLSGKHGAFRPAGNNRPDHYAGWFIDDTLSLSGEHSIIGKSIVIHKSNGDRWVCSSIVEQR